MKNQNFDKSFVYRYLNDALQHLLSTCFRIYLHKTIIIHIQQLFPVTIPIRCLTTHIRYRTSVWNLLLQKTIYLIKLCLCQLFQYLLSSLFFNIIFLAYFYHLCIRYKNVCILLKCKIVTKSTKLSLLILF